MGNRLMAFVVFVLGVFFLGGRVQAQGGGSEWQEFPRDYYGYKPVATPGETWSVTLSSGVIPFPISADSVEVYIMPNLWFDDYAVIGGVPSGGNACTAEYVHYPVQTQVPKANVKIIDNEIVVDMVVYDDADCANYIGYDVQLLFKAREASTPPPPPPPPPAPEVILNIYPNSGLAIDEQSFDLAIILQNLPGSITSKKVYVDNLNISSDFFHHAKVGSVPGGVYYMLKNADMLPGKHKIKAIFKFSDGSIVKKTIGINVLDASRPKGIGNDHEDDGHHHPKKDK